MYSNCLLEAIKAKIKTAKKLGFEKLEPFEIDRE